jgi:hypothetical protein
VCVILSLMARGEIMLCAKVCWWVGRYFKVLKDFLVILHIRFESAAAHLERQGCSKPSRAFVVW